MSDSYNEQTILAYIEGELSADEAQAYKLSMLKDAKLRRLIEQMIADRTALRQLPIEPVPIALVEQVEEYLERDMLLGPSVPEMAAAPTRSLDQPGPRTISPGAATPGAGAGMGAMKRWSMAAMAAVLLIGTGLLVFKAQYPPSPSDQGRELAGLDAPRDDLIEVSKRESTDRASKTTGDDETEPDVQSEMVEDRDATKSKQGLELLKQDLERILAGTIGFDDDAAAAEQDVVTVVVKDTVVEALPAAFEDRRVTLDLFTEPDLVAALSDPLRLSLEVEQFSAARLALAPLGRDEFMEFAFTDKKEQADESLEQPEHSLGLSAQAVADSANLTGDLQVGAAFAGARGPDAVPAISNATKPAMLARDGGVHRASRAELAAKPLILAADQAVALAKAVQKVPRNLTLLISSDHTGKSIGMIRSWARLNKASWVRQPESSKAEEVRRKLGAPPARPMWRTAPRDVRSRSGAFRRNASRTAEEATREQRWTLRIRPTQLEGLLAHIKSAKGHQVKQLPGLTSPKKTARITRFDAVRLKGLATSSPAASSNPQAARARSTDIKPTRPLPRITVTVIIQQRTPQTPPARQQPRKHTDRKRATEALQP